MNRPVHEFLRHDGCGSLMSDPYETTADWSLLNGVGGYALYLYIASGRPGTSACAHKHP